jgi:hypothetical protein
MELRAGTRLRSAVCDTEVIVVRAPTVSVEVTCGGHAMVPLDAGPGPEVTIDEQQEGGSVLGKRYADEDLALELLCTKAGRGTLAVNGKPLAFKQAKPLPSSD